MICIKVERIPDGEYCKDCRFKEDDDYVDGNYCFAFELPLKSRVRKLPECINATVDSSEDSGFW